jgi:hypothetical protein
MRLRHWLIARADGPTSTAGLGEAATRFEPAFSTAIGAQAVGGLTEDSRQSLRSRMSREKVRRTPLSLSLWLLAVCLLPLRLLAVGVLRRRRGLGAWRHLRIGRGAAAVGVAGGR